jgi:hypothetical protein
MASVLVKNDNYKAFQVDGVNNLADGVAHVHGYDSGGIVAQNAPGKPAAKLTSGFNQSATTLQSDSTPGAVGNALLTESPNVFIPMVVTALSLAASVGGADPILTVTLTATTGVATGQKPVVGSQIALSGLTSTLGKLLNTAVYKTLTVATSSTTQFTANAPGTTSPTPATGVETSSLALAKPQYFGRLAQTSLLNSN